MVKEYEAMDWSKEYTYKDKKIYIRAEICRAMCNARESNRSVQAGL